LIADADQARVAKGLGTLTSAATLTTLFGAYSNSTTYAADFHDITSGNNGVWLATVGYDAVTGLGSPKGSAIVSALIGSSASTAVATRTVATETSARASSGDTTNRHNGLSESSANGIAAVQYDSAFAGTLPLATTVVWIPTSIGPISAATIATSIPTFSVPVGQRMPSESDLIFADGQALTVAAASPATAGMVDGNLGAQPASAAIKIAAALGNQQNNGNTIKLTASAAASAALSDEDDLSATSRWAGLLGAGIFVGAYGVRARQRRRAAANASVAKIPVLQGRIINP
jgi:hypothetical protein